jgi:hypothetical protein
VNADNDAIGALAFFSRFNEACDLDIPDGRLQHRMSDEAPLHGRREKTRRGGGHRKRKRERDGPVAGEDHRHDRGDEERDRGPRLGLPVGGEVDDDPDAEGDREPRHEPSRRDLGEGPRAQPFADRPGKARESIGPRP